MSEPQENNNDSYMSMLRNPFINPGPKVTADKVEEKTAAIEIPEVKQVKALLVDSTQEKYLVSESDEPFEYINVLNKSNDLPSSVQELIELGLLSEDNVHDKLEIETLQEFFNTHQDHQDIFETFKKIPSQDSKVYLVGDLSITVLILCSILIDNKIAIVGLKSLLVQT